MAQQQRKQGVNKLSPPPSGGFFVRTGGGSPAVTDDGVGVLRRVWWYGLAYLHQHVGDG